MVNKNQFKDRWIFPLNKSNQFFFEMPDLISSFKKAADAFYFKKRKEYRFVLFFNKIFRHLFPLWVAETKEEHKFWNHDLTKKLFEIWTENIAGVKRGWLSDIREGLDFMEYMFELFDVLHDPKQAEKLANYNAMLMGLKILRPGNQANLYFLGSFGMRPMKNILKQYLHIAAITGNYDLIFSRVPPYHFPAFINALPGERTTIDGRLGFDIPPVVYRLDTKINIPIELKKIQTRSNDRFISCLVVKDEALEARRNAEIEKLENEVKGIFPSPAYVGGYDLGDEGKIYFPGKGGKEEIFNFGPRRNNFYNKSSMLNFRKANPEPGSKSGLIVKLNLLHPITALIEGINRVRELSLDEIYYVIKCLDLIAKQSGKPESERKKIPELIDEAFDGDFKKGFKEESLSLIDELERLRKDDPGEYPTEEKAWRFLIARLNEGKFKFLTQTLCNRAIGDTVDIYFSLFSLITGNELQINKTESGEYDAKVITQEKVNVVPLIDNLKRELEDLLKNVFSKYLDLSVATKKRQSEPILAGMIIEFCLNSKKCPVKFREKLEKYLTEHYTIHFAFIKGFLFNAKPPVLTDIYKTNVDIPSLAKSDTEGIIKLIEESRNRLYSFTLNSRLLCYIDPYSIDVQVGEFQYEGPGIDAEEFNFKVQQERRVKELMIMGEESMTKMIAESEVNKRNAQIKSMISEVKFKAIEALQYGDIKQYAILSLMKAHHDGGIQAVEKIMSESPTLFMTVNPDLHGKRAMGELKKKIVEILKEGKSIMDPVVLAMLMNVDHKDIVASGIYKEFSKLFAEIIQKTAAHHDHHDRDKHEHSEHQEPPMLNEPPDTIDILSETVIDTIEKNGDGADEN